MRTTTHHTYSTWHSDALHLDHCSHIRPLAPLCLHSRCRAPRRVLIWDFDTRGIARVLSGHTQTISAVRCDRIPSIDMISQALYPRFSVWSSPLPSHAPSSPFPLLLTRHRVCFLLHGRSNHVQTLTRVSLCPLQLVAERSKAPQRVGRLARHAVGCAQVKLSFLLARTHATT